MPSSSSAPHELEGPRGTPPRVSFAVFMQVLDRVRERSGHDDEPLSARDLSSLNPTQASEVRAALRWLGLIDAGDRPTLRLWDLLPPRRRAAGLRRLLEDHYSEAITMIRAGTNNSELEQYLVGRGCSVPTASKARRFLLAAVDAANIEGVDSSMVSQRARTESQKPVSPSPPSPSALPGPDRELAQRWLKVLIATAERQELEGRYDPDLHDRIERALRMIR